MSVSRLSSQSADGKVNARCGECQLRRAPLFRSVNKAELDFISDARLPQIAIAARQHILRPGERTNRFFTVYEGWAFRYRCLERASARSSISSCQATRLASIRP
jgi:hypothetical protein